MSQPSGSTASTLPIAWPSLRQEQRPLIRRVPLVRIRQFRPEEAVAVWNVLKAAVTTLIGRPYTDAQVSAWIADEEPKQDTGDFAPGCTVIVAESERRIIGFSRFSRIELEALYVHPAQSGCKVGELLLTAVERSVAAVHLKTLALDAALNAVSFYESAGYRVMGRSMPVFDSGVALPCVRMQKTLPSNAGAMHCMPSEIICGTVEISPTCPYPPRLPKRSRLDHWPSRAGCYRAWRG
jgi:putative acetyltransferase